MTDPAHFPIGTRHVFHRGDLQRTFTRVPGGWNGGGRLLDDASMVDEGWAYLRPAD